MCVANLNVSLQPCGHRWYQLLRQCAEANNLSNCPQKVRLEGWESRVEECPWCNSSSADTEIDLTTHKLFGGNDFPSSRRRSDSTVGSNNDSLRGRTNSISTFSTITDRSSSSESLSEIQDAVRAERNIIMNRRLEAYLVNAVPDSIASGRPSNQSSSASKVSLANEGKLPSRRGSMLGRWGGKSTKKRSGFSLG